MVRGLATANIRRILSVGQAALNRAYREGEITAVPQILLSLAPQAEARERLLTIDEARALFAGANEPHQFLYLMLAFATAARPAAILELTTFQVDSEARLIGSTLPAERRIRSAARHCRFAMPCCPGCVVCRPARLCK